MSNFLSSPKSFEPRGIGGGVSDGVLNVPMAEIILNEPGVGSLGGKREAASMAQHVGMGREGQGGCLAARIQHQIDGRAVQGLALLTHKERLASRFHPDALFQPRADCFQFIAA
jgi:hypothetical protein